MPQDPSLFKRPLPKAEDTLSGLRGPLGPAAKEQPGRGANVFSGAVDGLLGALGLPAGEQSGGPTPYNAGAMLSSAIPFFGGMRKAPDALRETSGLIARSRRAGQPLLPEMKTGAQIYPRMQEGINYEKGLQGAEESLGHLSGNNAGIFKRPKPEPKQIWMPDAEGSRLEPTGGWPGPEVGKFKSDPRQGLAPVGEFRTPPRPLDALSNYEDVAGTRPQINPAELRQVVWPGKAKVDSTIASMEQQFPKPAPEWGANDDFRFNNQADIWEKGLKDRGLNLRSQIDKPGSPGRTEPSIEQFLAGPYGGGGIGMEGAASGMLPTEMLRKFGLDTSLGEHFRPKK